MPRKTAKTVTFTDDAGNEIEPDDVGNEIDSMLEERGLLFVKGDDGHRYLVSVAVKFVRQG